MIYLYLDRNTIKLLYLKKTLELENDKHSLQSIAEVLDNYLVNTGIAPENVVYGDLYCELGKDPIVGGYGGRVIGKNVSRNR